MLFFKKLNYSQNVFFINLIINLIRQVFAEEKCHRVNQSVFFILEKAFFLKIKKYAIKIMIKYFFNNLKNFSYLKFE